MVYIDSVTHKHANMINLLSKKSTEIILSLSLSCSILKASSSLLDDSEDEQHFQGTTAQVPRLKIHLQLLFARTKQEQFHEKTFTMYPADTQKPFLVLLHINWRHIWYKMCPGR